MYSGMKQEIVGKLIFPRHTIDGIYHNFRHLRMKVISISPLYRHADPNSVSYLFSTA